MWSAWWVLAMVAIHVGVAHSWDIAVSVKDQLIFFTNGTKTGTVNLISQNPTSLVYDEIHDMMLYVDKQNGNDAVCGYDLTTKDNKCFINRNGRDIHDIAFDPATEMIFFTDKIEKSINWVSLKPECNNNIHGNLLIKLDDGTPADITVDSCRGYIYWTHADGKLERARFNGSERRVMSEKGEWTKFNLFIDPQTQQIFYFDVCPTCKNRFGYLNKNNLNVTRESWIVLHYYSSDSRSRVLTVSKDYIYWVNSSGSYDIVRQIPKNAVQLSEPKEINKLFDEKALGITAKYNIVDQVEGIQDCAPLSNLIPKLEVTPATDYLIITTPANAGERSDSNSAYGNYCLQGDISFDDEGLPKCRCNAGYSGQRCEINICFNFCLNGGDCFLKEEEQPACQCDSYHEGSRCEAEITTDADTTIPAAPAYDFAKRNFSLADFLSTWRKPSSKMYLTVEV